MCLLDILFCYNTFKGKKIHKCLQYNSMKSDHLFAVIIFNNVYIMLGAEIKYHQASNQLAQHVIQKFSCFHHLSSSGFLKKHGQSTFRLTQHPTTIIISQGFLKLFCRTGLILHNMYKHMCLDKKLRYDSFPFPVQNIWLEELHFKNMQ